ncbi:MAG: class I SAM-dependent methyltransferase [Acidimicrobiales bacterium]
MVGRAEWDRRYESSAHLFIVEADAELVSRVKDLVPGSAVDLGAGEGRISAWLARAGWRVTAVDFSKVALDRLRELAAAEELPIEAVETEIEDYVGGGARFDLVVMANIHPASNERRRLFRAAAEAVAPGGHLFVVGHHLDSLGQAGPPDGDRLYTEDRLEGAFPGLEVLEAHRLARAHGDAGVPVVDLVVWAARPPV